MNYRPPTHSDIGKTVEVRSAGLEWQSGRLRSLDCWQFSDDNVNPPVIERRFHIAGLTRSFTDCRVPYECPDPIAELSMAADWLAERGMDEASRVLMAEVEELTRGVVESHGALRISRVIPFEQLPHRFDNWFFITDGDSYLRRDGQLHSTCEEDGFYQTIEEAREVVRSYQAAPMTEGEQ